MKQQQKEGGYINITHSYAVFFFSRVNNEINTNSLEEAHIISLYVRFDVNRIWYMHQQGETTHNSILCPSAHFKTVLSEYFTNDG